MLDAAADAQPVIIAAGGEIAGGAGEIGVIVDAEARIGVARLGVDQGGGTDERADPAADIEVPARLRAQPVADIADARGALVRRRIARLALDAEHGAAGPEVVAEAGAVMDAVAPAARNLVAVPAGNALDPDAGERRLVLGQRGRGERRGGEGGDDQLTHENTPFSFPVFAFPLRAGPDARRSPRLHEPQINGFSCCSRATSRTGSRRWPWSGNSSFSLCCLRLPRRRRRSPSGFFSAGRPCVTAGSAGPSPSRRGRAARGLPELFWPCPGCRRAGFAGSSPSASPGPSAPARRCCCASTPAPSN